MIKTFRGLLADGAQERIRLSTIKGQMGYKVVKLQVISTAPGVVNTEAVVKIYKVQQSSVDSLVDFSDSTLLGVAYYEDDNSYAYTSEALIIFDHEIFNQDIYITSNDIGSVVMNYYLELEVVPLSDQGAEYTTLKDIRSATSTI